MLAKFAIATAAVFLVGLLILYFTTQIWFWLLCMAVPLVMVISALQRIVLSRYTTMEIAGDRLHYESGMFARSSRSVPLHKVQDVTVTQTLTQRLLGIGDLSIETAGETSRITIKEINSPRETADDILSRVELHSHDKDIHER